MLVEKLTQQDLGLIKNFTDWFGTNNNCERYRDPVAPERLLRYWDEAKGDYLWFLMGEKFILERKISYNEPEHKRRDKIAQSCCFGKMKPFYNAICNKANEFFPDYYSEGARAMRTLTDYRNLAINKIEHNFIYAEKFSITLEFDNGHKLKIDENTKPIRALGKLANFFDLIKEFEDFRLEHSLYLNQKKLEGTLCLSIHPMDYLTMSQNCSGWTSCMNWEEPGSYRMGTVEMMNSDKVIVAYLKSEHDSYGWPTGTWNNKHWRILIVVSPEGVVSIKGYPYYHAELTKECVQWILDLGATNLSWNFNEVAEIPDQAPFQYVDDNWYYMDSIARCMYNDFGCDTTHWGAFPKTLIQDTSKYDPIKVFFDYSGTTQCMCCGNVVDTDEIYDESYVYCENCTSMEDEDHECCSRCGQYHWRDDMYWVEDDYICSGCFDEVAVECAISHDYLYPEHAIKIYLARIDDNPNIESDEYIWVHYNYADRWGMGQRAHIRHPRHLEDSNIYYLNRADIEESGLLYWYGISPSSADDYFNNRGPFED